MFRRLTHCHVAMRSTSTLFRCATNLNCRFVSREKKKPADSDLGEFYFRDFGIAQQEEGRILPSNGLSLPNTTTKTEESKMQKVLKDLDRTLRTSVVMPEQERYLTILIQASGYGKTHLAHQYCLQHRALLMQFMPSTCLELLNILEAFIIAQRDKLNISPSAVADRETELAFTKLAFQATSLIPLTFIEFAEEFFAVAKFTSKAQVNEVLLRAIQNGQQLIQEKFAKNLKMYATNSMKFMGFKQRMYAAAKSMKLEAMIYDEVLQFERLPGMFLHHPFAESTSYLHLQEKRMSPDTSHQLSGPYHQVTSLLYLLRIAMEDLVKEAGIPQLLLSTHYSAQQFELPQVGTGARDRLKVHKFYWTESSAERWGRFNTDLLATFDFSNQQEIKEKLLLTLKPFAVRPVYLWPFWTTLSEHLTCKTKTFGEIITKALEVHKSNVTHRIYQYADKLLHFEKQEWRDKFLLQIALGRRYIKGTQADVTHLLQTGLIPLPEGFETFMEGINDTAKILIPLGDPFTLHYLEGKAQQHFDQLLTKIAHPMNSGYDAGLFGEVFAFALLRRSQGNALSALAMPGLGLDNNVVLQQFTIGNDLRLRDFVDLNLTSDGDFMNSLATGAQNYVLKPHNSFCPDLVVLPDGNRPEVTSREHMFALGLKPSNNIQAVLCIQSRFHAAPITPSMAQAAIDSLDPKNFYSSHSANLREAWEEMKQTLTTPHYWIRVISGRAVSQSVIDAIAEHNKNNPYQPILIFTPKLWPVEADWLKFSNVQAPNQSTATGQLDAKALQLTRFFDSTILNESDLNKIHSASQSSK